MVTSLRILLVEDNPGDASLVEEMLQQAGPARTSIVHVRNLRQALDRLERETFSAVLLDLSLPDSIGLDTFVTARHAAPASPIVVLTGLVDEDIGVIAVREGAQDYLVKGELDGALLSHSIRYAIERHRIEEQLRASEARFRQLADNIKEAFLIVELPSHSVVYASPMWEEIWGRPLEELQRNSQLWLQTIHPDDQQQVLAGQEAIANGHSTANTFRVVRPDGTTRWARARMFPVFSDDRRVYRMVGLVEDITEIRHTEEQIRHMQRLEAVGRLAGGIAHDFNNLLTAIFGYTDLARSDLDPSHPAAGYINDIRSASESAVRLTRQLLAFSRRQILQPRVLDLNHVLRRMSSLLKRLIGEDIILKTALSTPLSCVSADLGQIEQVVMNLAVNARDSMPDGGQLTLETADVELDDEYVSRHPGTSPGRHVMLAVSDTGVGMDDATQRRVFEPFFTTKEIGKGTGLGLATVYGIVKQSRGSIWLYSEPHHGSTFKIYLPAVTATGEAPEVREDLPPPTRAETTTILVAEDQAEVRTVIQAALQRRGYTVLAAANGQEALALSRERTTPIHLLFTDVVMPGMSGRQLAQILTAERPDLRVLYTSGYTDDTIVHHGVLDPGLAFIQKPFTAAALVQKIRDVMEASLPPAV